MNGSNDPSLYAKDKTWGIVVMALSAFGICCGLGVAGLGGLFGVLGVGAVGGNAGPGGANPGEVAAVAGLSGLVAIVGLLFMLASAVQVAGGYGIMKSRRWGFTLTLVFALISILLNVPQVLHGTGIVGAAINGVIAYYCWTRLTGKDGPAPV